MKYPNWDLGSFNYPAWVAVAREEIQCRTDSLVRYRAQANRDLSHRNQRYGRSIVFLPRLTRYYGRTFKETTDWFNGEAASKPHSAMTQNMATDALRILTVKENAHKGNSRIL
jgi:hypothetical protein